MRQSEIQAQKGTSIQSRAGDRAKPVLGVFKTNSLGSGVITFTSPGFLDDYVMLIAAEPYKFVIPKSGKYGIAFSSHGIISSNTNTPHDATVAFKLYKDSGAGFVLINTQTLQYPFAFVTYSGSPATPTDANSGKYYNYFFIYDVPRELISGDIIYITVTISADDSITIDDNSILRIELLR